MSIQLDAVEMVRRAERALGVAIRKGQEEGRIFGGSHGGNRRSSTDVELERPTNFATRSELYGTAREGIPQTVEILLATTAG